MEEIAQDIIDFSTSISGKVRNTKLPKKKALFPLFEVISNAIHAIEDKENEGEITVNIVRNGSKETLQKLSYLDDIPIKSFIVSDNGIGFDANNFKSFLTAESEYKIEKGAKGIGRFVCLSAFRSIFFTSNYSADEEYFVRSFELKPQGKGMFDYKNVSDASISDTGTIVELNIYHTEYQKYCPKEIDTICHKIIEHFLIYFLVNKCPDITVIDSNDKSYSLKSIYNLKFKSHLQDLPFKVGNVDFNMHILSLYENTKNHKVHYCGNFREVIEDSLSKYIPDLEKQISDSKEEKFTYQIYVTSDYLDKNVKNERTEFDFPTDDSDDDEKDDDILTLAQIRNSVIDTLEVQFADYLTAIREKKVAEYTTRIYEDYPQFRPILKYYPDAIKKMPVGLKGNKLNIELYRVQSELEVKIKELGEEVLGTSTDIRNSDEYKELYKEYIEKFNDIGKANLAQYIVHRKSVIELLDKFIGQNEDDSFESEETIHSIFFPIRSTSDEVQYEQQNLWLIDERLAYHYYLSSDKTFNEVEATTSTSTDRPDLLIFNNSFAFVDDKAPHNSFTIVEFKKPERKNYSDDDSKKNPIDQVIDYIGTLRQNKAVDRRGKVIQVSETTPFYAYIVCDINPKLISLLDARNFTITPDGAGYYLYHGKYRAYIEFITYQKVLKDASNRNQMLFEKLGLPV